MRKVNWTSKEEMILIEAINNYPRETHMGVARKIMDHPLLKHRTFGAIEQRVGYIRNRFKGVKVEKIH